MMTNVWRHLGIQFDGSLTNGEPEGSFSKQETDAIKVIDLMFTDDEAVIAANIDSLPLKEILSAEQLTGLKGYQAELIKAKRLERYIRETNPEFCDLVYDLLKAGKTLTATNLKPWMDKVDTIKSELPIAAVKEMK